MPSLDSIRRITVQGKDETADLRKGLADTATAMGGVTKAGGELDAAWAKQTQSLNTAARAQQEFNRGVSDVGLHSTVASFNDMAVATLHLTSELKLAAGAAYLLSPAFRSFTNTAVIGGLSQLGGAIGPVAMAVEKTVGFLSPAISLMARWSVPLGLAAGAFEILNATVSRGSELLDKYADSQRQFFSSDVESNLKKLTKFQQDTILFEQVQLATELGARLQIAKQTIADFLKVQMDLTDPALKLQGAWVLIVETIAKGVSSLSALSSIVETIGSLPGKFGQLSIWNQFSSMTPAELEKANAALNQGRTRAEEDISQIRARGLDLLKAGMGNSFGARFSGDIAALANPKAAEAIAAQTGEFDRLEKSIQRHIAATEADAQSQGQSAGEVMRLREQFRLLEVAQQDIDKYGGKLSDYSERIKQLSDRAGEAAQNLARAKMASDISFGRQSVFLGSDDAAIAQQLRHLYGDDVPKALASSEAAALRLNAAFKQVNDLGGTFASGFFTDLSHGVDKVTALHNALTRLSDILIDMASRKLVTLALGGLFGGPGTAITGGSATALYHSGGIVGSEHSGSRYVHPAYFDGAPHFQGGGLVGGEQAIIAHKGEGVFTPGQMAAMGGGGDTNHFNLSITMQGGNTQADAQQADMVAKATVARLQSMIQNEIRNQKRPRGLLS